MDFDNETETTTWNRPLMRWTTTEDPVLGGADGRQKARRTGAAPSRGPELSSDGDWAVLHWEMAQIPEWHERTITSTQFEFYDGLAPGIHMI